MEMWIFLLVIFLIHFTFCITDFILKSCQCHPYIVTLDWLGVTIRPLQVRWCTTIFNRPLAKWAISKSKLHKLWFTAGVVIVAVCVVPSIGLLFSNVVQYLSRNTGTDHQEEQLLKPIIPGVNLASDEIPLYFLTLLVSSVMHEAGHAVAAVKEGVHVDAVGLLLVFVLPGAFVMLPTDAMAALHPFRKLKVLCGGVWHNVVLASLAVCVGLCLPTIYSPLYSRGRGAFITQVTENSPARGPRGLLPLDVVRGINDCHVSGARDWHDCLVDALTTPQQGYCIPDSVVYSMDETVHHAENGPGNTVICCPASHNTEHLCFELLTSTDEDAESVPMHPFACLPARPAIAQSPRSCRSTHQCPSSHFCLAPSLVEGIRLLRIQRTPVLQDANQHQPRGRQLPSGVRKLSRVVEEGGYGGVREQTGRNDIDLEIVHQVAPELTRRVAGNTVGHVTESIDNLERRSEDVVINRKLNEVVKNIPVKRKVPEATIRNSNVNNNDINNIGAAAGASSNEEGAEDEDHHHERDVSEKFRDVLYLGSPVLLYQTVSLTDFIPTKSWLPLTLVDSSLKICDYFIKFSGALALLNLVPCVYLDGQYITEAFIEWTLSDRMNAAARGVLQTSITGVGTLLLASNVLLGFASLIWP